MEIYTHEIYLHSEIVDGDLQLNMDGRRLDYTTSVESCRRGDWLVQVFQDWSFTFLSSFLYYEDYDEMEEETREIYQAGMAAFEGIAPEYHIELRERPAIVWDFHSLLLAIQMMFSFMLGDETSTLKLCPNCYNAFFTENVDDVYCGEECELKNR